jgi:hypothetical protein
VFILRNILKEAAGPNELDKCLGALNSSHPTHSIQVLVDGDVLIWKKKI